MYVYSSVMNKEKWSAGVVGATGYTGQELAGLIMRHPRLELAFATSESEAGHAHPWGGRYVSVSEADLGGADIVFVCLPTGESGEWALRASAAGALTIDLSGDLRGGESGAVYGLPELWRESVKGSRLVSNPGCYPTGVLLSLAPAISLGLVDPSRPVIVNAASGVTGAGRSARRDLLFGEVSEEYRAYGVGNRHRHVPEIRRGLDRLGGAPEFVFTPHLLPVRRGILETICLPLREPIEAEAAITAWSEHFAGEPFVEIVEDGLPMLREVVGRNVVRIGISAVDDVAPMLLVVAALDNLLKGAAGQAVQNANLMLGLDEREGLVA